MDRFEAMRTLLAAVDGGSLSAASRSMSVPLPTVSRRVSDLEAQLGTQLVVRTSRKLILTEAGAAYVAAVRQVIEQLGEAERAASGEYRAPRGVLAVTAPIMFGKLYVAPIVHNFLSAYPEVGGRLILSDGIIDVIEAHIDVAVRIGDLPDSSLVARRIGEVRWVTCASPDYLKRRGAPATPADLLEHDCIAFEGLELWRDWTFMGPKGPQTVIIRPRFSVNTGDAVIAAASAGVGIAFVTTYQAADAVAGGRLVPVLRENAPDPVPVHLVHARHAIQPLKQRAFMDFVPPRLKLVLDGISAAFGEVAG